MRFMFITIACFIAVLIAADQALNHGHYFRAVVRFLNLD
jgi:hypothetical protein